MLSFGKLTYHNFFTYQKIGQTDFDKLWVTDPTALMKILVLK